MMQFIHVMGNRDQDTLAAARKMDADLTAANRLEGGAVFTLTLKSSE